MMRYSYTFLAGLTGAGLAVLLSVFRPFVFQAEPSALVNGLAGFVLGVLGERGFFMIIRARDQRRHKLVHEIPD